MRIAQGLYQPGSRLPAEHGVNHALRTLKAPYRPFIFDMDLRNSSRRILEQEAAAAIKSEGIAGAIVWPPLVEGSVED